MAGKPQLKTTPCLCVRGTVKCCRLFEVQILRYLLSTLGEALLTQGVGVAGFATKTLMMCFWP